MEKSELTAAVYERRDAPGIWAVEAINHAGEGEIYIALFDGPAAQERAQEYAEAKYTTPQRRFERRTSAA